MAGVRLRRQQRRRQALRHFQTLSRLQSDDPWVWFYLAVTLDNLGQERSAIPRYQRTLRLDPRHPKRYEILLYLCSSCRKVGWLKAARRYLQQAQATGRTSPLHRKLDKLLTRDLAQPRDLARRPRLS